MLGAGESPILELGSEVKTGLLLVLFIYLLNAKIQKGPAPLVFLIAGTGGTYDGEKNTMMGKAFYQAGFHIISLSSPTE